MVYRLSCWWRNAADYVTHMPGFGRAGATEAYSMAWKP